MNTEFSNYPEAKRFIQELSNQGIESCSDILQEYKDIYKDKGPFLAAIFIKMIYDTIKQDELLGEYANNG